MRRLSSVATSVVLTLTLAGAAAAQEAPADPSPAAPEASAEAATVAEPLPTAYFYGEWDIHRQAAHGRILNAMTNIDNAKAKQKAGYYRSLVKVLDDELQWLSNYAPEDCYTDVFDAWRTAVEEMQASGQAGAAAARKGNKGGLRKAAKRRDAAWTEIAARAFADPPDPCMGAPELASGPPILAGKWLSKPVYVEGGGVVDKNPRKLTIGEDGGLLLQVPGHPVCRDGSRGKVTLVVRGTGEVVTQGRPGFEWLRERVDCKRKSGQGNLAGPAEEPGLMAYDAATDVLLMNDGPECYWRVDGGSPQDCQAFWQGTLPSSEDASDAEAATAEEAAATPDESAE